MAQLHTFYDGDSFLSIKIFQFELNSPNSPNIPPKISNNAKEPLNDPNKCEITLTQI